MSDAPSTSLASNSSAGLNLARLAKGVFRVAAALAAVICCSRFYRYLLESGLLESSWVAPGGDTGKLLYTGPAILVVFVKLAVGMLILGSCGVGLALLVRWTADGLRPDPDD